MDREKHIFSSVTKKQNMEFGVVLILVSCVLAYSYEDKAFIVSAIVLSLLTIILPVILTPITFLWFGLSNILGKVSSTILLSLIFYLVVTPVGLVRRIAGKDSLRLKQFKQGTRSVMIDRNHLYIDEDLKDTF